MNDLSLLHYRIEAELGRGGMGIVYRARDTKLDRPVALKVLPAAALASEDDRARFYREAKAAASLTHAHIAGIYQIDEAVPVDASGEPVNATDGPRPFIAMEFIEGQTLQERIQKGPLRLSEAVRIAIEVADALKAAHAKGIVHRDIKSANIMLTDAGEAKVLDFGLAQTSASTKLTRMGSTLGTVAYMSPEQARGEVVDGRSDLYALGTVLYEMVAGRLPFAGEYEQAVVYGILNETPEPLTGLRTGVPMELERIVGKLLAKAADNRYQAAADLIVDLRNVDLASGSRSVSGLTAMHSGPMTAAHGVAPAMPPPASSPRSWIPGIGGLIAGALVVAVLAWMLWPTPAPPSPALVDISLEGLSAVDFPAMSPTGDWMAVKAIQDSRRGIFVRNMATGVFTRLDGSENSGDRELVFSPDGMHLAFTDGFNGGVMLVVVPAGIPRKITEFGRIAFWLSNTEFLMTDDRPGGGAMYIADIQGGEPRRLEVDLARPDSTYGGVAFSHVPGTRRAFGHQIVRSQTGGVSGAPRIFTFDVETGEAEIIEENAINPYYVRGGWLMYQIGSDLGRLVVRPIDPRTGRFTGQPVNVLSDRAFLQWGKYAVTESGDFLYLSSLGFTDSEPERDLFLVDLDSRSVTKLPLQLEAGFSALFPRFHDRQNAVLFSVSEQKPDGRSTVVSLDLATGSQVPLTYDGEFGLPAVSSDGKSLYMIGIEDSVSSIFVMPMDRSSAPRLVVRDLIFPDVSPDGTTLVGTRGFLEPKEVLMAVDLATGQERVIDDDTAQPVTPRVSPDGRYVAYSSPFQAINSSIHVRSLDGRESFTIPNVSAAEPVWSPDGRWLYVTSTQGVLRIPVRTEPSFNVLGEAELILAAAGVFGMDISEDGRRLVLVANDAEFIQAGQATERMVWIQHWPQLLARP